MRIKYTISALLLLAAGVLKAELTNPGFTNLDVYNSGAITQPVRLENNSIALGANGYIATAWMQTIDMPTLTLVGAGALSDVSVLSDYGPGGFMFMVPNGDYYNYSANEYFNVVIRVYQVGTGLMDDDAVANAYLSGEVLQTWNDILTSGGSYGEYASTQKATATGALDIPLYTVGDLTWTTVSGGQVPEPSTYAVLVGLAILAFVAARRVRK